MTRKKNKNVLYIILALFAIPLIFKLFSATNVQAGWYNNSWLYRKPLVFNNSGQASNLSNFPVLITLNSSNFKFTEAKSAGEDLRFTDSNGTTLLSYEIETYDPVSQSAKIWVNVPQINATSSTDFIYLYWGNAAASDTQDLDNTWNSNYKGVYHLNNNATSTTVTDSSGLTNTITAGENTNNGFYQSSGKIGGGFFTGGTPTYITNQSGQNIAEVYPDIVLDSSGFPVIAYTDLTNFDLILVHCNDKECKGGNESVSTVDSTNSTGYYPSIQLDSNGYPMIAYQYQTGLDLKYVHCNDANCSGGDETFSVIETTSNTGSFPRMVKDGSGLPVIAYYYATGADLKLVHCGNIDCSSGNQINNVDTTGTVGNGYHATEIVLDSSGYPVISYYDTTNTELKVAHCNDVNCAGSDESLTSPISTLAESVGITTSIEIDGSGFPMIAYYNTTDTDLEFIHCDDVNCAGDESSTIVKIDTGAATVPTLEKNSSGIPVIIASTATGAYPRVYLCSNTNCSSNTTSYLSLYNQNDFNTNFFKLDANNNIYAVGYVRGKTGKFDTIFYSTNHKLERAYDTDFDFGTSSFSVSSWFKSNGLVQQNNLLSRYDTDQGFRLFQNYGGQPCFGIDDDATWGPDDSACSSNSQIISNVDNGNATAITYQAVSLDSSGYPIIAYYDSSGQDLEIIHCNDENCAGSNENYASIDSTGDVGNSMSITLDASGYPVISYYDTANTSLKTVHCGNANCSSGNTINTIDGAGADSLGTHSSIKLDSSGYPIITYYDSTNTSVKLVHCNDVNCSGSDESIVTLVNDEDDRVRNGTESLQLDASGYPIVVYSDLTNDDLKLIHCNDANCTGGDETKTTIESTNNVGDFASMILDSNGYPVIVHYDATNYALRFVHCGNANCSSGNTAGSINSPNSGDMGYYGLDIRLNASGYPVILSSQLASWSTVLTVCNDVNCSGGNETNSIIRGDTLHNRQNHALVLDSNSYPVITLATNDNDLRLIHMTNGTTYTESGNYDDSQWHHMVGVKNGTSSITLYIDGVAVATDSSIAATGTMTSNSASLNLAEEITNTMSLNNWTGYLDEVQLDTTARSSDWVRAQYLSESGNFINVGASQPGPAAVSLGTYSGTNRLTANLVAYYKFNEGYGTTANNSGNGGPGLNGTITGATWNNNGKYGKSLQYNGSTNSTIVASVSNVQSVSFWINPSSTTQSLMALTGSVYISVSSGTISATGFTSPTIYVNGKVSSTIIANQWQNVTVTTATPITASAITLGRANGTSLTGLLDEVKIYNAALTADEIKIDYNQGNSISLGSLSDTSALSGGSVASNSASAQYCVPGSSDPCSPPIGEWNFEEGSGTTTNDTSGNGNTGTIAGATYISGKTGKALNFNGGTDTVTISNSITTNTVEFWINPTTTTQNLIDLRTSATATNISIASGTISAAGFTSPTIYVNGRTSSTLVPNIWQYVSITTSSSITANAIQLGRISSTSLSGKLDGVKFYSYARTPSQITWDYNQGKPIAHWKLNECSGTVANDSSGNGNAGTITIGATGTNTAVGTCTGSAGEAWKDGATGKFNASLDFDGTDDYVSKTVTSGSTLDITTNQITLSGWVKINALTGTYESLFGRNTNGSYRIYLDTADKFVFQVKTGSVVTITSANTTSTGTWYHVLGIYDGANMKLFINGQQVASGSQTGNISTQSDTFYIGRNNLASIDRYFDGQIDDVRIYNYALTPTQIKNVYNEGSSVRFGP